MPGHGSQGLWVGALLGTQAGSAGPLPWLCTEVCPQQKAAPGCSGQRKPQGILWCPQSFGGGVKVEAGTLTVTLVGSVRLSSGVEGPDATAQVWHGRSDNLRTWSRALGREELKVP